MKPYRTGVVIGKFYPPHKGHHHLIRTASARCDHLRVLVCWKPEQSVPIDVRLECLREEHPEVEVIPVADTLPDDDSPGWAAYTVRILGAAPEAVFTSEDYGDAYARCMGAVHVMVDRHRRAVPCSGTMIRARPLDHLDCLSPCVRAFYVLRVCVLGAESTGTTTLAEALAAHFRTAWVPEYGRGYCVEKWKDGYTDEWTTEEFVHIATEQCRREDTAARAANRVLICDTDAFATAIWHRRYVGRRSPEVEAIAERRRPHLYLLTGDEIPFEQDGYRDGERIRHRMHEVFEQELAASGRRWVTVRGTHAERMARATMEVDWLLDRS
ncbi:MAG: AAA family ATPase [Armatimonadetes bacterium]|nr:AAA family ATPase [Armatimonadota bacterium]